MIKYEKKRVGHFVKRTLFQFHEIKLVVCYFISLSMFDWRGLSTDEGMLLLATATPLYAVPTILFFFGIICQFKNKLFWG